MKLNFKRSHKAIRIPKSKKVHIRDFLMFLALIILVSNIVLLVTGALSLSNVSENIQAAVITAFVSSIINLFFAAIDIRKLLSSSSDQLCTDLSLSAFSEQMNEVLSSYLTRQSNQQSNQSVQKTQNTSMPTFVLYSPVLREHWLLLQRIERDLHSPRKKEELQEILNSEHYTVQLNLKAESDYLWYAAWEKLYFRGMRVTDHAIGDNEFGYLISQQISTIDIEKLKLAQSLIHKRYQYEFAVA